MVSFTLWAIFQLEIYEFQFQMIMTLPFITKLPTQIRDGSSSTRCISESLFHTTIQIVTFSANSMGSSMKLKIM